MVRKYDNRTAVISDIEIKDNLSNLQTDLGRKFKKRILKKNYRTKSTAILKASSNFIIKAFGTEAEKYTDFSSLSDSKNKYAKPVLRFFSHQKDELKYVLREIEKHQHEKIAVLSLYKKDLQIYRRETSKQNRNIDIIALDSNSALEIQTAYAFKGLEADVVFFVGFNEQESSTSHYLHVINTIMTRAKSKLYITSSYPVFDCNKYFNLEDFDYRNSQRKKASQYNHLPIIRENRNNSLKKLKASRVDSITFRIKMEDAPFCKYVPKNDLKQHPYEKKQKILYRGVNVTVKYHNTHKRYFFEFYDLSLLKKNGYDDYKILRFCSNYILDYFDNRINLDDISISLLDLNKYFKCENNQQIDLMLQFLCDYFRKSRATSIYDRSGKVNYLNHPEAYPNWDDTTFYVNMHKRKNYGIVIKAYKNSMKNKKKKSSNIIH